MASKTVSKPKKVSTKRVNLKVPGIKATDPKPMDASADANVSDPTKEAMLTRMRQRANTGQ